MKYISLLAVLVMVLNCGTDQGERDLYTYKVINNSGVPVEVRSYRTRFPNDEPIVTKLAIGDSLDKSFLDGLPPSGYSFIHFFSENSELEDSLNIIYDNSKIEIFTKENCTGSIRNPFNTCEYKNQNETFIFTEQDFLDAEDCSGNCD